MKKIILILILLFLAPQALAIIDCSPPARMEAAELHYKAGCLLAALRICANSSEFTRAKCYAVNEINCAIYGNNYRRWLNQK